jgi:hypothetical protein
VFDLVGGVMFRSAVNCLALRGRLRDALTPGFVAGDYHAAPIGEGFADCSAVSADLDKPSQALTLTVPDPPGKDFRLHSSARCRALRFSRVPTNCRGSTPLSPDREERREAVKTQLFADDRR